MLKALRKHLKASKKSTHFMQYMKINRKEELDNNWINCRHLDDLVDSNVYSKDYFPDLINSNNINYSFSCNQNYNNYHNERQTKSEEKKRLELQSREETKIKDFEAIQLNRQHLHALHRFRRHKKRGISSEKDVVISFSPKSRLSIVNKREFFYRFGKAEAEAIACFDFLNDIECDFDPNDASDEQNEEPVNRWPSSVSVGSKDDNSDDLSIGRYSQLSLSDSCVEYYDSSD